MASTVAGVFRVDYLGTHRVNPNRWGVWSPTGRLIWDCGSPERAISLAEHEAELLTDEGIGMYYYVDISESAHALAFNEW